ncbi:MAG: purine-nucleoside phosphorylase [Anaerolineae bacterium]|nr:purine-nucleoside phosphorylase [Anaerolineae bacterium]
MVQAEFTLADYQAAAQFIQDRSAHRPRIALILGSGLGPLADAVEDAHRISYADIPGWPRSQVVGHGNRLVLGRLEGKLVMVMQGRSHFYEGWTPAQTVFPVRVMQACGIRTLIVTNAAGGLNPDFSAGDLMLMTDHINLPGLVGFGPLRGPNDDALGPRFPDMTVAYDLGLRRLSERVAAENGIGLRQGVYVGLAGPAFETPAEVRMLRMLGSDAVGMSTVNEVTVARHAGMRVLGFSGITNVAITEGSAEKVVNHEEVLDVGSRIVPKLITLLRGVIAQIE